MRIAPEVVPGLFYGVVQDDLRVSGEIVEQSRRLLEEQRQVVLDACRRETVGDILVEAAFRRIAFEALAEILPEAGLAIVVERKFARRQQTNLVDRINAALGIHIKGSDGLDIGIEQIDAVGHRAAHGEEIDQPAAHGIFAGAHHLRRVGITGQRELSAQLVDVEPRALLQKKSMPGQVFARWQAVQGGSDRHDGHIAGAAGDLVQRLQPFRYQVGVGREMIVGQGFPVGKKVHRCRPREPGNLLTQPLAVPGRFGDDDERAVRFRQLRQCQRVRGGGQGTQTDAFGGGTRQESV